MTDGEAKLQSPAAGQEVRLIAFGKILIILLGIGIGALGVGIIVQEWRRIYRLDTWPKVDGRILGSEVTVDYDDLTSYGVRISYQFQVYGTSFQGSTQFGDGQPAVHPGA